MKKNLALLLLLLVSQSIFSQTTIDPKVERKSSYDVYVNKIVIDDNFTVVSMKYVSKSLKAQVEEYLENNPEDKKLLDNMDEYRRRIALERLAMSFSQGGNSISFQPNSYLLAKDGRRFKFVKASSIPVSPENIIVEADKRYYFKIYFEKLEPGIETVDIIEGEANKKNGLQYWNFYGVEVNNPGEYVATIVPKTEKMAAEETKEVSINLKGIVLNSETDEPIAAKIICIAKDSNVKFDSIITSKSGRYEFVVSADDYVYQISAAGYETSEESFDLSNLKTDKSFTRNFYLTPLPMTSEIPPLIEDKIAEEEIEIEENIAPVEVDENTFRLDKVYFDVGQASILPESYGQLEGLLKMLQDNPKLKIEVVGHTDNQGDSKLNKRLSVRRAFEVRQYLIGEGIDGKRIKFKGMGDSAPIAQNDSEENRSQNRRVEFIILEK